MYRVVMQLKIHTFKIKTCSSSGKDHRNEAARPAWMLSVASGWKKYSATWIAVKRYEELAKRILHDYGRRDARSYKCGLPIVDRTSLE